METATHLWILATSAITMVAVSFGLVLIWPVWDTLAAYQMGKLATRFKSLSLDVDKLQFYLRVWVVVWVVAVVGIGYFAQMPPLAILTGFLIYVAPRYILDHLIRRRARLLRDQLVGSAVALANAVRAGLSIAQGLETVAAEAPQPLKAEFDRIVFDYQHGRPLKEAIEAMRTRLDLEEFTLFALAIEVSLERGGRLNEALERICVSLREKQRLERKLASSTAAGRHAVVVLTVTPIIGVIGYCLVDDQYYSLMFHQLMGQVMLAAIGVFVYLGERWAWKIINFEF